MHLTDLTNVKTLFIMLPLLVWSRNAEFRFRRFTEQFCPSIEF